VLWATAWIGSFLRCDTTEDAAATAAAAAGTIAAGTATTNGNGKQHELLCNLNYKYLIIPLVPIP
jgi:hypothetical protein